MTNQQKENSLQQKVFGKEQQKRLKLEKLTYKIFV